MIEITITNGILLFLLAGCITTLLLIGMTRREDPEGLSELLGQIILLGMVGWLYVLFIWIFSFRIWTVRVGGDQ